MRESVAVCEPDTVIDGVPEFVSVGVADDVAETVGVAVGDVVGGQGAYMGGAMATDEQFILRIRAEF